MTGTGHECVPEDEAEFVIMSMAVHELAHEIHFSCGFEPGRCKLINEKTDEFLAKKFLLTDHAYTEGLPKLAFLAEAVSVWLFEDQYQGLQADLAEAETKEILTWVEGIVVPPEAKQPRRNGSVPLH